MKFSVLENFSFFRRQKVVQFGKPGIGCKVTKYISNGNAFSQIFFLVSQKRRNEHLFSKSRIIVVRVKTAWKASELQAQGSALGVR